MNINSVVGGGVKNPQDALTIGRRAVELGFTSTVGIIHDGSGQLQPLDDEERAVYQRDEDSWASTAMPRFNEFQDNIAQGQPEPVALPRRLALPLHLRRRPGALLLAAARLSRHSAGRVHRGRHPPRVPDRESLRAPLHHLLRAPDLNLRFLARPADP